MKTHLKKRNGSKAFGQCPGYHRSEDGLFAEMEYKMKEDAANKDD